MRIVAILENSAIYRHVLDRPITQRAYDRFRARVAGQTQVVCVLTDRANLRETADHFARILRAEGRANA